MSRIGKAPITVPSGVTVAIEGNSISVKGPKGELARTYSELITIREDGDQLLVERADDDRLARAQHGRVRSLVQNMVTGVTAGFQKDLDIVGVEPALYPSMTNALTGRTEPCAGSTLAEGIAVRDIGLKAVPIVRELVKNVVTVTETGLERAMAMALWPAES